MKNNLLKYYIVAVYFCSTLVLFAEPGVTDDTGSLESSDPYPINDYIWIVVLIAIGFAFFKIRSRFINLNAKN